MTIRCRADGLNTSGRSCRHCDLDDAFLAWELRLFRLQVRSPILRSCSCPGDIALYPTYTLFAPVPQAAPIKALVAAGEGRRRCRRRQPSCGVS